MLQRVRGMPNHGHPSVMLAIMAKTGVMCSFSCIQLIHIKCLVYAGYSVRDKDIGGEIYSSQWAHTRYAGGLGSSISDSKPNLVSKRSLLREVTLKPSQGWWVQEMSHVVMGAAQRKCGGLSHPPTHTRMWTCPGTWCPHGASQPETIQANITYRSIWSVGAILLVRLS